MSKSPIKDYTRLLGQSRTLKKEDPTFRLHTYDRSDRIVEELKLKLDLSLRHNTKLLDENSVLSELVSQLRYEVRSLNENISLLAAAQSEKSSKILEERAKLEDELQLQQKNFEFDQKRLLEEISILHKEKNELEIMKNKQLDRFKMEHEKNTTKFIESLKSTQDNSKDLYETQINKLKDVIEILDHEIENNKTQRKLEANRLNNSIQNLENQIKHLKHLNQLQIQEMRKSFDAELHFERRGLERERQIQASNLNVSIKRLKNELLEKNQEIEAIGRKMSNNEEMHSVELQSLKREKEALLSEITTAEINHANNMLREKTKLKQINQQEISNVLNLNETHIDELKSEANNLKNLLDCKNSEIRRLYQENNETKKSFFAELKLLTQFNEELNKRLKSLSRDHLEQSQAFKIKMAQLLDADIKGISSYYQNEITMLLTNLSELEKINGENRERLYQALQENDEIRKNFEIEVSKQKARVQDLKIKLAAMNLEHKQQVTSLATKINLTSQTLIRETEQKNKSQAFFDEQKKKFHSLSNSKDKQIADLMETMHRMKSMHESDINVLRTEKKELRDQIQTLEDRIVNLKKQFEEELKRREAKSKSEKAPDDDKATQQFKELYEKNEKIENQNIRLQKQVEHLIRENRSIAQELGLKKGFIETLQLQSCAAIEDEKSKLKILMGNSEVTLKQYYEDKIKSRQKDIDHLKIVLSGKEQDIRDLIVKYNGLEKRLELLLESQEKVADFEEKIKSLGLDNNLVKNMAELFARGK